MRNLACILPLLALLLPGCGGDLSGRYDHGDEGGASFTFKGKSVEIEALGSLRVGSYRLDDGKVYISIDNKTEAFRLDDQGCILGGFMFGKLCKH